MAITVPSDFLSLVRNELADTVTPYLWSDNDLYEYMNEAQREFARETKCLPDSFTYQGIPLTLNDGWISFDPTVIEIRRAVSVTNKKVLEIMTMEEFSEGYWEDDYGHRRKSRWEDETGEPTHLLTNLEANEARLYPIPATADTVDIYVYREPVQELSSTSVKFEIPERFIYRLVYKIKELAYSKQDYETFSADSTAQNRLLWEIAIADAQSKIKKRARKPRSAVYGGL